MEVAKFRSQLLIALERMGVYLRQKTLAGLQRGANWSRELEADLRAGRKYLWRLAAISRDEAVVAKAKIVRQVFIGLGLVAIHLRRAENAFLRSARSVASKPRRLQQALCARE